MFLITKITAGTSGPLKIRRHGLTGDFENAARLSRSKLLDGECSFSPYAVTDSDRDLKVECRLSEDEAAAMKALFDALEPVKLSFWEGFFTAYIFRLTIRRNGDTKITFYLKEKLA